MTILRWTVVYLTLLAAAPARAQLNRLNLGAHLTSTDVSFRIYSSRASKLELDLFAVSFGAPEVARVPLTQDPATSVWAVTVPLTTVRRQYGITGAIYYGYRAWGPNWPFDPAWTKGSSAGFISDVDAAGNRFNPNKLLLDPYAREMSFDFENPRNDDGTVYANGPAYRTKDSGQVAPKGIVLPDPSPAPGTHLTTPLKDDIIYEVNVRGLTEADSTIPANIRGTYAGAARKAPQLAKLGVTAVEFLPVQETQNDANDVDPATANYFGYMTLNYFAPDRRYSSDKTPGGPTREFTRMVKAFHAAHLKVFVDVVYNHTGEGYAWQSDPTLFNIESFRGLDNPTYYLLTSDNQNYYDNTGTGGDYNTANQVAQDLIVDSLAYWYNTLGADGFRFDLAPVLGNTCTVGCFQYDKLAPGTALHRIVRDLPPMPLFAEPWTASGDGYQLGQLPAGYSDWNGKYRDLIRQSQNKLGVETFTTGDLATRFSGSSDLFQNNGRKPWNSINFIDIHDGLTLNDVYSFTDGDESWDHGGDRAAQIQAARTGFTLLMLSAGTPIFAGGDEFLRTLNGNNNPYNIDNAVNWLNYNLSPGQQSFYTFAHSLIAFRLKHPALRPADFYTADQLQWLQPGGGAADTGYFSNPDNHAIAWLIDGTAFSDPASSLFIAYNAWSGPVTFTLPSPQAGKTWVRQFDSSLGSVSAASASGTYVLAGRSAAVLTAQ